MKLTRKILAVALSLVMLALCVPFAFAESGIDGSITWNYDASSKTLTIGGSGDMPKYESSDERPWLGFRKEAQTVVIQDGVTGIGFNAFINFSELKSISIPKSVKSIGGSAFQNCKNMTSADLGSGVTSIGPYAFEACYALTSVTMGNSVTAIGTCAFSNCQKLQSLSLSTNLASIDERAFENCYHLSSLSLPNSLKTIGEKAFLRNNSLQTVSIPGGVISIGANAFADCTSLKTVNYGGNEAQWNAIPKGEYVFGIWRSTSEGYTERTASEALTFNFGVASATLTLYASTVKKPITNTGGTVIGNGTYELGKQITISAVPSEGMAFDGWYNVHPIDGITTKKFSNATETITLTGNMTLAALFRAALDCTVTANASEGGTASGGGTYKEGKTATLTAAANSGWRFIGWYNGSSKVSDSASYSFTVSGNVTLTAKFEKGAAPAGSHTHIDKDNDGKCDTCKQQMTGGDHCPQCGKIHKGFFQKIVGFFHKIIYRLSHLFDKKEKTDAAQKTD